MTEAALRHRLRAVILYDHPASANCMTVRILLGHLGAEYERVTVDLFLGETRTPVHFARNLDGRIPVLELDSGETLPESNAILLHLGEGTPTVADIALYASVHCAGDADIRPEDYGALEAWLRRVEAQPGFVNDLAPIPAHVAQRSL